MSAGRRVSGTFFRVLTPRWAHAPLSGEGSARQGGRFNRPRAPALYLSRDLATAWAEYQQIGALIRPGTVVAYDIAADGIADLTDSGTLLALGVAVAELHCAWRHIARIEGREPPTWRLADRLLAAGMNGLLARSAVHAAGVNLVLWRWGDAAPVRVRTQDPQEDLPRDQSSWPRGQHRDESPRGRGRGLDRSLLRDGEPSIEQITSSRPGGSARRRLVASTFP